MSLSILERAVKCDKCGEKFIQKWIVAQKWWSKINQVSYWTDGKGWETYKLVCRNCLKDWFINHREHFNRSVDPKKKRIFINYKGYGVFDKSDKYNESKE